MTRAVEKNEAWMGNGGVYLCVCKNVVCNFKWVDQGNHFENMKSEPRLKGGEGNIAHTSGNSSSEVPEPRNV